MYLLADEGGAKVVGGGGGSSTHGEGVGDLEVGGQDLGDIAASSIKDVVGQEGVYLVGYRENMAVVRLEANKWCVGRKVRRGK